MLKLIISLISNLVAVLAAQYFIAEFEVTDDYAGLAVVILLFTVANSFLLPMLRLIFTPVSWLTFGLFPLILNGALIYIVDILSDGITINGLLPLVYATIIIGIVNGFFAWGAKAFK